MMEEGVSFHSNDDGAAIGASVSFHSNDDGAAIGASVSFREQEREMAFPYEGMRWW